MWALGVGEILKTEEFEVPGFLSQMTPLIARQDFGSKDRRV